MNNYLIVGIILAILVIGIIMYSFVDFKKSRINSFTRNMPSQKHASRGGRLMHENKSRGGSGKDYIS